MFALEWTAAAREQYDALKQAALDQQARRKQNQKGKSSKAEGLFKQVNKTLRQLGNDPRHPSLIPASAAIEPTATVASGVFPASRWSAGSISRAGLCDTHEFSSLENPFEPAGKVFEAYAQNNAPGAYRLFWCYGPTPGKITIIAITPHP